MESAKVSVVLLIYMVEKFLPKCIESAINQSYENIEIILSVSRGTDRCIEICEEYAKKDERIVVIEREKKGRGPGRNFGLEAATGEYIIFIDGDDYMGSMMIEKMVDSIKKYEADLAICADCYEYEADPHKREVRIANLPEWFDKKQMYQEILSRRTFGLEVWNKLYRLEKIKDLMFPDIIAEDRYWSVEAFERVDKIAYIKSPEFHYVIRGDSGSRKPHVMEYSMKADAIMCKNIKEHGYLGQESDSFLFLSCYSAIYEALHFGYFHYGEWADCYRIMKDCAKNIKKMDLLRRQDKIKIYFTCIGYRAIVWFMKFSMCVKPAGLFDNSEEDS